MDTSSLYKLHMERDRPKKAGLVKIRFIIAVLATLCPIVCYISRQNLPFAIISMVDDNDTSNTNSNNLASLNANKETQDQIFTNSRLPDSVLGQDLGLLVNDSTRLRQNGSQERPPTGAQQSNQSPKNGPQLELGSDDTCPVSSTLNEEEKTTSKGYGAKYRWSADDKGFLLGAFFYTYVFCQIPGARLAERIGSKWILVAASFGSGIFSFISPWAASQHVYFFSFIRLLMGVCQAALYPTCYVLYSKWLPPIERSQALPILCAGAYVGSIIASSLTGYFSEQPNLGWEYAFYVPGVMCTIWTVLWIIFATNEPRDHHSISIEELVYIESRMEQVQQRTADGSGIGGGGGKPQISWYKLFTSQSIWAMMAGFFASNWSFTVVLLLIPTYLNRILNVSPLNNGIINSIIYILYCVASPLVGAASTMMVETRPCGISRLNVRKFFQGTALIGQAVCFIALPLMGCNENLVFAVLFIQIVLFSLVNGGEVQLPTELSVDFAGTIYAIGNCVGSSTGFIVPLVYSQIVRNELSRGQWEIYFYVAALISTVGGILFVLFGLNQLQDFSKSRLADSQVNIFKRKPGGGVGSGLSINMELDVGSYRQTNIDSNDNNRNAYTGHSRMATAS